MERIYIIRKFISGVQYAMAENQDREMLADFLWHMRHTEHYDSFRTGYVCGIIERRKNNDVFPHVSIMYGV